MNKYMRFDVEQFLKDSVKWPAQIAKKLMEQDAIPELKAQEPSAGHSNGPGDPTSAVAAEHEKIQKEIDQILIYQNMLANSLTLLSEEHREIIEVFFFKPGYKSHLVEEYGRKYGLCTKMVYATRREALEELRWIITSRYIIK